MASSVVKRVQKVTRQLSGGLANVHPASLKYKWHEFSRSNRAERAGQLKFFRKHSKSELRARVKAAN